MHKSRKSIDEQQKAMFYGCTLYAITNTDVISTLTFNKLYEILAEFGTDLVGSGYCIVVLNDKQQIMGYDSDHFDFKIY